MDKQINISVCIPVYNGEETITRAIESVLKQTYKPLEIIVCDNASTDKTEQIVKPYILKGIKYYRNNNNIGMYGNWNKCIELSRGDWIYLLHDDDEMLPNMLLDVCQSISKYNNENIGMIFGKVHVFDDTIGKQLVINYPFNDDILLDKYELIKYISKGNFIYCPGVLVSKKIYDNGLRFVDNFLIDYIMWVNINKIAKVLFINKLIANYHLNNDSLTITGGEKIFIDSIKAIEGLQKDKELLPYFDNFNCYIKSNYIGLSSYYFKRGEKLKSKTALSHAKSIKNNFLKRRILKLEIAMLIQFISHKLALKFLNHNFHLKKMDES